MSYNQDITNAIRILTIDAIDIAQSGHPGMPMGMADIAEVLWRKHLNHNPNNPNWINRDRFVLSNGHGSMLIYSLLHLTGYNLSIDEIKKFRQINSKTPGHPEYNHTPGVEVTTGPLGQGLANAVGFAIAEQTLANQFNKNQYNIIDHYTYVFVGDGCMMEGISHEVCSLAGTLKLGKLIIFYDNNNISIDGNIKKTFNENTYQRFKSYKWHVINNIDGHNRKEIHNAIKESKKNIDKPSLIICNTVIGYGSPSNAGTCNIHGTPLSKQEISLTRKKLKWKYEPFIIPQEIYEKWDAKYVGQKKEDSWNKQFIKYSKKYPQLSLELNRRIKKKLPKDWIIQTEKIIKKFNDNPLNISTREASKKIIEKFAKILPEYLGGSADLSSSNLTIWPKSKEINKYKNGNYIYYGIREFGMTAIANGISIYKGFIPYTATFLTFFDYAKNAVRMAALMSIQHILIYTHDSIGVGEDGPTHQPIEQLSHIRTIPNLITWRPCDQVESIIAWKYAIENNKSPTALIFSRQVLQQQIRNKEQLLNINKGAYILKENCSTPQLIIIATGSEVELAIKSYKKLIKSGYNIRIVSMPSTNIFDKQTKKYRDYILPPKITNRMVIEASHSNFWFKYIGLNGTIIGIKSFGISGASNKLFDIFGFTVKNIIKKAKQLLNQNK